jgi:hypothetical protein
MHPTIQHQLASARIADLRRQAERARMAQAVRSASHRQQAARRCAAGRRPGTVITRRVIAVLAAWPTARRPAV